MSLPKPCTRLKMLPRCWTSACNKHNFMLCCAVLCQYLSRIRPSSSPQCESDTGVRGGAASMWRGHVSRGRQGSLSEYPMRHTDHHSLQRTGIVEEGAHL